MSYIGKKNGNPNTDFLEAGGELENHDLVNVDSSGNFLVGTTSTLSMGSSTTAGVQVGGDIRAVRTDGNPIMYLKQQGNDGQFVNFYKDTTSVGSIGVYTDDLSIGSINTFIRFQDTDDTIRPTNSSGANRTDAIDLGASNARFKDLYLGGGVYVGGTGSANYLDDYEEGTWTATVDYGTVSQQFTSTYIKVGSRVTIFCDLRSFSDRTTASALLVRGLPFTAAHRCIGSAMWRYITTARTDISSYMEAGNSHFALIQNYTGNWTSVQHADLNSSSAIIAVTLTYKTNS